MILYAAFQREYSSALPRPRLDAFSFPRCVAPRRAMPRRAASRRVAPRHTAPHHTAPHQCV